MEQTKPHNFGEAIDRTLRIIKLNYLQVFRELGADITTEQWVILDQLSKRDGIPQSELGNASFKNAPTVSRIIALLRQKKLISKQQGKGDKRQTLISLTEAGRTLHQEILPHVYQLRQQGWQGLTDEDFHHLTRVLQQIEANFNPDEEIIRES
ncbi:MAG: MarR family transcriptional regulator [Saprospiraceae bacterium]